ELDRAGCLPIADGDRHDRGAGAPGHGGRGHGAGGATAGEGDVAGRQQGGVGGGGAQRQRRHRPVHIAYREVDRARAVVGAAGPAGGHRHGRGVVDRGDRDRDGRRIRGQGAVAGPVAERVTAGEVG